MGAQPGITVAVATDGLGFYVEPMLRAAGVDGVAVHGNRMSIGPGGVVVSFPESHPVCTTCGACKMTIVQRYRAGQGPVAFVGEGHTDRYGALYADLVFAKKNLPEICRADGVPFLEWSTFDDVRDGVSSPAARARWTPPEVCPGWNVTGRLRA